MCSRLRPSGWRSSARSASASGARSPWSARRRRTAALVVDDPQFGNKPVDVDLAVILGLPPKMVRDVRHVERRLPPLDLRAVELKEACYRVLRAPTVANKSFLVTIGDRTVGGLCARDQMVGPWQVPVADCAVTLADFAGYAGEAFAIGERTPLAVARRARLGPHGGRRGAHQPRRRGGP